MILIIIKYYVVLLKHYFDYFFMCIFQWNRMLDGLHGRQHHQAKEAETDYQPVHRGWSKLR